MSNPVKEPYYSGLSPELSKYVLDRAKRQMKEALKLLSRKM